MRKTWFITGASRGLGRIWAEAALARGDRVAATARNVADVAELTERFGDAVLPLALDVSKPDQVPRAVAQEHAHFGRLDVVLNNAGYTLIGTGEDRGDPRATADAVFQVVDAEDPPLRVALGAGVLPMARAAYAERLATWESWAEVSNAAQGESPRRAVAAA